MELINNIAKAHGGFSVFAGGAEEREEMIYIINDRVRSNQNCGEKSKAALVYGQMNEHQEQERELP